MKYRSRDLKGLRDPVEKGFLEGVPEKSTNFGIAIYFEWFTRKNVPTSISRVSRGVNGPTPHRLFSNLSWSPLEAANAMLAVRQMSLHVSGTVYILGL